MARCAEFISCPNHVSDEKLPECAIIRIDRYRIPANDLSPHYDTPLTRITELIYQAGSRLLRNNPKAHGAIVHCNLRNKNSRRVINGCKNITSNCCAFAVQADAASRNNRAA
jgi:hypothetical protein